MRSFWLLTGFEYKKLFQRKIVWITLAVMIAACILLSCISYMATGYTIDGEPVNGYDLKKKHVAQDKEASGTRLDGKTLKNMEESPSDIPGGLFNMVYYITGGWEVDGLKEQELYQIRENNIEANWESARLSKGEKKYMAEQEEKIEKPLTYEYSDGYQEAGTQMVFVGLLQTLLIAICIPSVFAEEHIRKTDQLNLCTNMGKKTLYLAKIAVGISFSLAATVMMALAITIPTFLINGLEGFDAPIQSFAALESWAMTAGERLLIMMAMGLLAAILHSAAGMLMSEKARGNVAPMAVMVGFMLVSLFATVPDQYRALAQAWDLVPGNVLSATGPFGVRLFQIFGRYLAAWQVVPIVYLAVAAVCIVLGGRLYKNYQVSGR